MGDIKIPQPPPNARDVFIEKRAKKLTSRFGSLFNSIKTVEKIFFVQTLAVLIKAGFSLSNALSTVAKQTKRKRLKEIIESIAHDVEEGQTFAASLRKFEKVFDPLFINMVESGEVSGKLEMTLRQLAVQLKESHTLHMKVRNAMAYPVIILITMLGIGTGMMIFVIPKIVDLYRNDMDKLPFVTKLVIYISDFVVNRGILTVCIAVGVCGIAYLLYRNEKIKVFLHHLMLRMPLFGTLFVEFNLARISRVFHSLISTDISVVHTFQTIAKTVGNRSYKKYLNEAVAQLEKGTTIGVVLSNDEVLFPATMVEIMIVGEQSGSLDEMSGELAEHYEEEVASALDGLSVLIEPILMLFLGVGVGTIAVAVLWPMYNLVNVI